MRVVQVSESEFTVQGHGVHTAFVETTNGLKKQLGVEVLINKFTKADVRHIHTFGPYSLLQMTRPGKKIISAHLVPNSLVGSIKGARFWLPLAKCYLRWFYNRAQAVVAVSDETKKELEELGVKKPIHVIYNMVDSEQYKTTPADKKAARTKFGYAETDWIVVGNGQVQPRKRVDIFLKLAHKMPDVKFVWIGGIPFKALAAEQGKMLEAIKSAPKNVHFTDLVGREDVKAYMQTGDIFFMPSDQETFGLAIVEGAAVGLPVLLRDISDYDHTFRQWAVMSSEADFKNNILKMRDDRDFYQKMQAESAKLAARFDSKAVVGEILGLYKKA